MESEYGITLSFVSWLGIGLPIVAIGLPIAYLVLTRLTFPLGRGALKGAADSVDRDLASMGAVSRREKLVGVGLVLTDVRWVTRPLSLGMLPSLDEAGIAMDAGVALFLILRISARASFSWTGPPRAVSRGAR